MLISTGRTCLGWPDRVVPRSAAIMRRPRRLTSAAMTADLPPYLLDRADEKIGRWFASGNAHISYPASRSYSVMRSNSASLLSF